MIRKAKICNGCDREVPGFYMRSGTSNGIDYEVCALCEEESDAAYWGRKPAAECEHLVAVDYDRPCAACLVESGDYSFNAMLFLCGYTTRKNGQQYQREILRAGEVVFVGTAHEASEWLLNDAELPERVEAPAPSILVCPEHGASEVEDGFCLCGAEAAEPGDIIDAVCGRLRDEGATA